MAILNHRISVLSILLIALTLAPEEGICVQRMALIDSGTYTFQNVADRGVRQYSDGFLTAVGLSEYIVTDIWRDAPGQKFKVQKGFIYTSYLVKPLSEGLDSKVAVSVGDINGVPIVKKERYTFGMSSSLYWSVIPAEGSFYMIQNMQNDLCLESRGLGQAVGISPCRNAVSQQWAVHSR